jgi:hypothetical protein
VLFPRPDSLVSYQISYIPHHSCHGFDHGVDHHEALIACKKFYEKKKKRKCAQSTVSAAGPGS